MDQLQPSGPDHQRRAALDAWGQCAGQLNVIAPAEISTAAAPEPTANFPSAPSRICARTQVRFHVEEKAFHLFLSRWLQFLVTDLKQSPPPGSTASSPAARM
jgi:hypothetical protein